MDSKTLNEEILEEKISFLIHDFGATRNISLFKSFNFDFSHLKNDGVNQMVHLLISYSACYYNKNTIHWAV